MSELGFLLLSLCLFAFFWGTNCGDNHCWGLCQVCESEANTPQYWTVDITNGVLTINPLLEFACEDAGDCCWNGTASVSGGSLCTYATVWVELCVYRLTISSIRIEVTVRNSSSGTRLLGFGNTFAVTEIDCQAGRSLSVVPPMCDGGVPPWTCDASPSGSLLKPCCYEDCDCTFRSTANCFCFRCTGTTPTQLQVDIIDCDCADLIGTWTLPCIGSCLWQYTISTATCGAGGGQRRLRVFWDSIDTSLLFWIINDDTGDIHIFRKTFPGPGDLPTDCAAWSAFALDNLSGVTGDCGTAGEAEITAL